ncbi:MAG: hypothetical protein HYV63_17685 [Candidatus Schekmanbacteria bacterium]|nr:hypothetical protein [Candidatus Schekmanbacteria bacterium]
MVRGRWDPRSSSRSALRIRRAWHRRRIELVFDPSIIKATATSVDGLITAGFSVTSNLSAGRVAVAMISGGDGLPGGTGEAILSITFEVLASGTTPMTLASYHDFDRYGRDMDRFGLANVEAQAGRFLATFGVPVGGAGSAILALSAMTVLHKRRASRRRSR